MSKLTTTMAAVLMSTAAMAQAPAFPGAEGHGRYTTGGRGATKVVHVTNLNDSGTGSFREVVKNSDKKIIVFDVAGVIPLKSDVKIGSNTTILGQTAPYPGITLRYYTTTVNGNNVIVRFLRFRRGEEKDVNDGADTFWGREYTGIIIDHCSMSWSIDEIGSWYDNNNFTMQWCLYGESLNNAGHDKGAHGYGGIWGGKLASFHHNMIAHVNNRAPRFNGARYNWKDYTLNKLYDTYKWENAVQAENVDFRNCVMFDWGGGGCYGGPGGGYINMVNNYYKSSPETSNKNRVTQVSIANNTTSSDNDIYQDMTSRYYINGNFVFGYGANYDWSGVKYDSGILTINGERYSKDKNYYYGKDVAHVNSTDGVPCVSIKLNKAMAPVGEVTTHSAENAYEKVLSYTGASLFRDDVDNRYVTETRERKSTYTGSVTQVKGRIDKVADCKGYTEKDFPTGKRDASFDTDGDGIPDSWEIANGLDPKNPADAVSYSIDKKGYYQNIEVYANSLVEDLMKAENLDAQSTVDEYYPETQKAEGVDYYSGKNVERLATGDQEDTPVAEDGKDIVWNFTTGAAENGNVAEELSDGIESATVSLGSNLKYNGTKGINGVTFTKLMPATKQLQADPSNAITFIVTPKTGYSFKPTKVSFLASRLGTDGGTMDIAYNGEELDRAFLPNRNNSASGYYSAYTKTITEIPASTLPGNLTLNVYNLNIDKELGLSKIIISGVLLSSTGIQTAQIAVDIDHISYYDLNGRKNSGKGIKIKKTVYKDGSIKTSKQSL